jgi:hypothetical protein
VAADAVDVDLGRTKGDAEMCRIASVGYKLGGVEHRLGRDTADMSTGAAGPFAGIDERYLFALVRRKKRRGIATGTRTKNSDLRLDRFSHEMKPLRKSLV